MLLTGVSFGLRRSIHGCPMAIWAVFPLQPQYQLLWSSAFCQILSISKSKVEAGVDNKHSFSKQNSLVNHPDEHFRTLFYSCISWLSFQLLQKKPWPINSIFSWFLQSILLTVTCPDFLNTSGALVVMSLISHCFNGFPPARLFFFPIKRKSSEWKEMYAQFTILF